MHYGFLDESGILERKSGTGRHLVIIVLIVGNPSAIKTVMKAVRRKAKGKYHIHIPFKASIEDEGLIKLVLSELGNRKAKIVVGVWDKRDPAKTRDKIELYINLVSGTVKEALRIIPKLHLVIHRRYTEPRITKRLSRRLGESAPKGSVLVIDHCSEREIKELELADAVAWAVFQKYNRKRNEFYNLIKHLIVKESRLAA